MCGNDVTWNSYLSYNLVILCVYWVYNRIECSSDFRRGYNSNSFSVFSYNRLYIVILNNLISFNIKIFYLSLVSCFKRKSYGVSLFGLSFKFNKFRFFSHSKVKNSILVVYLLLYRSSIFFSKDFRFGSYSLDKDFRLSSLLSGNYSWFELDYFGVTLLLFLGCFFLPS